MNSHVWPLLKRFGCRGGLVVVSTAPLLASCASHRVTVSGPVPPTTTASTTASAAATASTTLAALAAGYHYIATARVGEVAVFAAAGASQPTRTFANPWFINGDPALAVPLVFAVEQSRPGGWLNVLLPVRPNGSTGWIRASDVEITSTPYHISVSLSAHRLTVYSGTLVVLEDTVAVGAPQTPTPTGLFYIRALLKAPHPNTVYGPYAYGLSGYSETLEQFAGGNAEVGIHGNNDASVLGRNVSHGCIRMSNDAIKNLTHILPLGIPVDITP